MEDEIKLIHQKVNDIISRPSRWFFNWGIVVTTLTIFLLILVSFVVPYKEELTCKLFFNTKHDVLHLRSSYNGVIIKHMIEPGARVSKGQPVLLIRNRTRNNDVLLYSTGNGYAKRSEVEPTIGDSVRTGEDVLDILPDITAKDELYCVGYLDKFDISKLNVGNKVSILVEQYNKQVNLNGTVSTISNYPVRNNLYPVYVALNTDDINDLHKRRSFYYKMNANATITYKSQKIGNKFFAFLK